MLHVGMNIENKAALFAQVRRVLRPGAPFSIYDIMRESDGEFVYPVPWSAAPETNFIAGADTYRTLLADAGFNVVHERNRRDFAIDFFRQMQTLGATIQDHTLTHPQLKSLGWSDQHHQICDEIPDLTSLYGTRPTLFRPPYGEWNETTRSVVAGCGLHALILWRGATNDGRLDILTGHFNPGDIILMHFRTDLVENLQLVLSRARAEGYRIGRLEDYLGTGPAHPMFDR